MKLGTDLPQASPVPFWRSDETNLIQHLSGDRVAHLIGVRLCGFPLICQQRRFLLDFGVQVCCVLGETLWSVGSGSEARLIGAGRELKSNFRRWAGVPRVVRARTLASLAAACGIDLPSIINNVNIRDAKVLGAVRQVDHVRTN